MQATYTSLPIVTKTKIKTQSTISQICRDFLERSFVGFTINVGITIPHLNISGLQAN